MVGSESTGGYINPSLKYLTFPTSHNFLCSSAPIAKGKKEYVIPLRKTKWRFPGNRKEGEEIEKELSTGAERKELIESGGEVGGKSQEEMELDREAVEAVWKGEWWVWIPTIWHARVCLVPDM